MTSPRTRKNSRPWLWFERFLLLLGILGLGAWALSVIVPAVWQDWESWVFDQELQSKPASISAYLLNFETRTGHGLQEWLGMNQPAPLPSSTGAQSPRHRALRAVPPTQDELIGRLSIPRLHLRAVVREGDGQDTLGLAVGHIPGTALPGQPGNVAVAGHRDTFFRGLGAIRQHDIIQFETLEKRYRYEVESTLIVDPEDVAVLNPDSYRELTLVSCYPFHYIGPAPERFIVKARQIAAEPILSAGIH